MNFKLKSFLKLILKFYFRIISINHNKNLIGELLKINNKHYEVVKIEDDQLLKFYCVNKMTKYRIKTFFLKEPDTISWIKTFQRNSVFWDIGANIGLYSVYASKISNCQTYAFEPSVYNLELLTKNIFLNKLENKISLIPVPLGENAKIDYFYMNNPDYSSALSSFSYDYDQDGKKFNSTFKYKVIGFSGSDLVDKFNIKLPNYIKIDVDGAEHLILKGFDQNIFSSVAEILIEINEKLKPQMNLIQNIMSKNNFSLKSSYYFSDNTQFNGIWKKND